MTTTLHNLVTRWQRDAAQYEKQVAEAREAGSPCEQMLSMMTALRACAKELDDAMKEGLDNPEKL